MKILYRQCAASGAVLGGHGIENCYLKWISLDSDAEKTTKKEHFHNCFELHLVERGGQEYDTEDGAFRVLAGEFLLVPAKKRHRFVSCDSHSVKISFTFSVSSDATSSLPFDKLVRCASGSVPATVWENIEFIRRERATPRALSEGLIANRVFESIVLLLRGTCDFERESVEPLNTTDARIDMAKQYIRDNARAPLAVSDVAGYCYISPKQLTRLFYKYEGTSPADYIKREKIRNIERLLASFELSLAQISEEMGFTNEYYFNSFFKKNYGMPPGQYRKTMLLSTEN